MRKRETWARTEGEFEGIWLWGTCRPNVVLYLLHTGEEAALCSGCEYRLELACFW